MLIRWPLAVLDAALVVPIVLAQTTSPVHSAWAAQPMMQATVAASPLAPGNNDMALGPEFEVATIRPGDRSDGRRWFGVRVDDSGRFMVSGVSLEGLVNIGFGRVDLDREAPKWVNSEDFDINAKLDDAYMAGWDKMSDAQRMGLVRPMVRRLLVDRFKLKLRMEMRDIPVYVLVQSKGGTKMKEVPPPPPPEGRPTSVLTINCPGKEKEMTCMGKAVPMSQLIGLFAGFGNLQVGRTVIDETGLKGYYDYSFTVSSDADADPPIKQIEDQLGLRFEPRKVPRMVYVIESAEKPSLDGAEVRAQ
jgi:uncharacterized protein (TIGR03435 family)